MRETDHTSSQPAFDPLREALHAEAAATTDLAFGPGQRYDLADGHLTLEVFPDRQLSRITTPTSRLELFASPAPQVIDGHVVFRRETGHEDTSLSVSPEGTVVFGYVSTAPATPDGTSPGPGAYDCDAAPVESAVASEQPATAPEPAQEPPAVAPARDMGTSSSRQPTRRAAQAVDPQQHHADPIRTDHRPDQPAQEQQPRVQLTGRLGRDPSFRTSPRGTLIRRFPLAVHRDDGTTTWHTILRFW